MNIQSTCPALSGITKVLFDFDGTLFDTQRLHTAVEVLILAECGVEIDATTLADRYAGIETEVIYRELLACDDDVVAGLVKAKWERLFPRHVEAVPLGDLHRLCSTLIERGIDMAIGTTSNMEWVRSILTLHNLTSYFPDGAIVTRDMVKHGKPHPDIWRMAAGTTPPAHCLVVEDSLAGVQAAIAAGISVALLPPRRHDGAYAIQYVEDIVELIA